MEQKQPVVIELSTNLSTGVTSFVGATAALCPKCGGRNTTLKEGEFKCLDEKCKLTLRA